MTGHRVVRLACVLAAGVLVVASPAAAQMTPLGATGWNRDIVVESGASTPYSGAALNFDVPNNWALYEAGLPGSVKGLPASGAFSSLVDGTLVQLQPYNQPNALFLTGAAPTGTLSLVPAAQTKYDSIAIFASSANGGGTGTLSIRFSDSSVSGTISFNAQDWFNVTTNNALINLGRVNLGTNAVDDGSAGNPRIYHTTINLAALGLNNRDVVSIDFTKPTGAANTTTAIFAISGMRAVTSLSPVATSGYNRDIVVENTGVVPFSSFAEPFDTFNSISWYENGLPGSTKGLPQGGAFVSVSNAAVQGQLQPYNAANALFLDVFSPTGTLTFDPIARRPYEFLAVFASSSNQGGIGTMVIEFTDATTSGPISFNAQDWFNVTTNNALNNLGRVGLNQVAVDDASAGNPRLYQTVLDLSARGLSTRSIASITFTKPNVGGNAQNTAIMGISGQPVAGAVGGCVLNDGSCVLLPGPNCPGTYLGDNSVCPPTGACIAVNGDCTVRTQANCAFVGGSYQGNGSSCPGAGSCIAPNGACTQLNPFQCAFQGGTFQGSGSPCPTAGGCCVGGTCVVLNSFQCAFQSGTFQGAGSGCLAGAIVGQSQPSLAIPDTNTVTDNLVISDTTPLDALFLTLNINHTFIGDLTVTLTFFPNSGPPIGPIDVFNRPQRLSNAGFGSGSDLVSTGDYVFGDGGNNLWAALAGAPASLPPGFYSPSTNDGSASSPPNGAFTSFAPFAGLSPAGTWTITITDSAGGDVGTLNRWSINRGPCPTQPAGGACCMGSACVIVASAQDCIGANMSYAGNGTSCNSPGNNTSPCCRADYNHDGSVGVPDIFAFLSDWFAQSLRADFDNSGVIGVPDIFAFLSAWFAGGC